MATGQIVDFSNVKEGGNFNKKRIPSGDYLAKITKIDDAEAKDGVFQYLISIKIEKFPTSVLPYYCKLQENQLWKLRNLLIAGGLVVPKKRTKVDPNRLLNKMIGVTIEDAEYEGKDQSEIAAVFPAAELGEMPDDADEPGDEEDEEGVEDEPEEAAEDEAEEEVEDFSALTRVELKARIKEYQPDFVAKKSQTDEDLADMLTDLVGDNTPADEDEPEDEEEEEAPAPVRKAAVKKAPARKAAATVTDEELEELDIDDL